MSKGGH